MKIPLLLMLAASTIFVGCSSSSYPGSSNYPAQGYPLQYPYPGPGQYPYPIINQYPYSNYPSYRVRNDQVIVTRDGRLVDKYGRVVGTARAVPAAPPRQVYGSRIEQGRDYDRDERRREERYETNPRRENYPVEKRREFEKGHENQHNNANGIWQNRPHGRDVHK